MTDKLPSLSDVLFVLGGAAVIYGVYRIYAPLAFIVGGLTIAFAGILRERTKP